MPVTEIDNIGQLREKIGQELAVTDWVRVTQERINLFAEATGDHQWIHLDAERAKNESPYGVTIAHGFLTLSLVSDLMSQALHIRAPVKMGINYGLNRVRFTAAVPAGANVRARFTVKEVADIEGGVQITWGVVIEREGSDKPCCVAEWITRRYE
ncbi:MAG: MaoC family dehydratase [Blastocatellia bacterium]